MTHWKEGGHKIECKRLKVVAEAEAKRLKAVADAEAKIEEIDW